MSGKAVTEFVIPKCSGKGFIIRKGQRLRVTEHEGKQVAGLIFLNAHNHKEQFTAMFSGGSLNEVQGIGTSYRLSKLYSKVPYENVMLTVTDDKIGHHFLGPHCTKRMMEVLKAPGHRSCSDNIEEALSEFGLLLEDIYSPSVFNAFMNARIDSKGDGTIVIDAPVSEKGDYIEFRAEMDVLAVISACPDDQTAANDHECKSIKIQIFEE